MYKLQPEMARELKNTNNRIYQNAPAGLSNTKCIITVGDVCTIKIYEQARMPDLSIIDFKTKRDNPLSVDQMSIMNQIGEKIVNVNNNAGCNVPLVKFNVHCSGTHTETASHVFSDADSIGNLLDLNFLPAVLISLNPESNLDDKYHSTITLDDRIISKEMLKESLASETEFIDCIIIRTLPNSEDKKSKNYNNSSHPFLSNDAVYFLKDKGVKHIIIDTPSIDKSDDGGQLKNHKLFFLNDDKTINKNTVTELAYIPDTCIDGRYFVCIGFPNFQLDAAPSNPVIYRVQ